MADYVVRLLNTKYFQIHDFDALSSVFPAEIIADIDNIMKTVPTTEADITSQEIK